MHLSVCLHFYYVENCSSNDFTCGGCVAACVKQPADQSVNLYIRCIWLSCAVFTWFVSARHPIHIFPVC